MRRSAVAAVVAVCLALGGARAARADGTITSLDTVYVDVGGVYAQDAVIFGDGPKMGLSGRGLRYYERHCCLARFLAATTIGLLLSAGAASPYSKVESKTYQSGDYIVTETTYTYKTEEEKRQQREAAAQATADIMSFPFTMELIYFPDEDDGKLHGFQWSWYLYDFPKRSPVRLELGLHWDSLGGRITDEAGNTMSASYKSAGKPVRAVFRPVNWIQADVEWRWNWLSTDDLPAGANRNEMVRAALEVQLPLPYLNLFYGRVSAQSNNVGEVSKTGYLLEVGLRL
jgi:hypothetical protein